MTIKVSSGFSVGTPAFQHPLSTPRGRARGGRIPCTMSTGDKHTPTQPKSSYE